MPLEETGTSPGNVGTRNSGLLVAICTQIGYMLEGAWLHALSSGGMSTDLEWCPLDYFSVSIQHLIMELRWCSPLMAL